VFTGVFEEIFLRPPGEHSDCQCDEFEFVVGADDCGLVTCLAELSHLAHSKAVAQSGATLGQLQR
jgi:hypothetical protein